MFISLGLEVGAWEAPDGAMVDTIARWWRQHPLDRATRCLRARPELVSGPADAIAGSLHDVVVNLPVVPVAACADLFLLPPELVRPIDAWCFATVGSNMGATFGNRRLGLVHIGDCDALDLPRSLVTNSIPMSGPGRPRLPSRLPQPRDLIAAAAGTPTLAAAARAADLLGSTAVSGRSFRVRQLPWRLRPLWDEEFDIEEWDPDDPSVSGLEDVDTTGAPTRYDDRREKREWLGI